MRKIKAVEVMSTYEDLKKAEKSAKNAAKHTKEPYLIYMLGFKAAERLMVKKIQSLKIVDKETIKEILDAELRVIHNHSVDGKKLSVDEYLQCVQDEYEGT